jgi:ribosomal protein L11 methyltransferase
MILWQFTETTSPDEHDALEEWAWIQNALAVERGLDPSIAEQPALTFFFADGTDDLPQERFSHDFPHFASFPFKKSHLPDNDWERRWREHFQPLRSRHWRIACPWHHLSPGDDLILVYPGQAFGTGQHATTQLALDLLKSMDVQGKTVLDVGCGTGILGIAAKKLGATQVFALDHDPVIEENFYRHMELNQVQGIQLEIGTLPEAHSKALQLTPPDVVVANITLNVLKEIWPMLPSILKEGAFLISTGILHSQLDEACQLMLQQGFLNQQVETQEEWVAIVSQFLPVP